MQPTTFKWTTKKMLILGGVLLVFLGGLYLLGNRTNDKQTGEAPERTISKSTDRVSARVYIKKFDRYIEFTEPETRFDIERMLYNYSYILKGYDLYTGVIRPDSFERNVSSDGKTYRTHMLIDIIPTNVTYRISVIRDRNMNYKEGSYILCATKSEQIDQSVRCIDEGGR